MRKNILTLALAGALVAAPAAYAGDGFNYQLYGRLNVSLDLNNDSQADLRSNTSAIGIKGSQKLGDSGTKAIFKVEWQIDPTERNKTITDRDQWIGIKGDFGKVLAGTMTMNYKQTHATDIMWRTNLEGRGFLNTLSNLHKGAAEDRGRMTNTIQYQSAKMMGGLQAVGNVSFSDGEDDSYGVGIRYKTKEMMFWLDTFHDGGIEKDAWKVGGSFKMGALKVGAQYEAAQDVTGYDYIQASAAYKMDNANTIKFQIGQADGVSDENTSWALLFDHKVNKQINMYAGYGSRDNKVASDTDLLTVGATYKF